MDVIVGHQPPSNNLDVLAEDRGARTGTLRAGGVASPSAWRTVLRWTLYFSDSARTGQFPFLP